ncbi:MAG: EamA family transporter, partial [Gammaproteobacteria bacterium]
SIGAVTLWFVLMKRGEASKVSSLFHLIPGATAIMGYFVLGETLSPIALAGFAITGIAVYLSH